MSKEKLGRVAKGKRPMYFHDPATDKLMAIVVSLVGELAVTRDRLDALERMLEAEGKLSRKALDEIDLDEAAIAQRDEDRHDYIRRVMRIVTMELERPGDDGATATFTARLEELMREGE
jgi:hypothetical protein